MQSIILLKQNDFVVTFWSSILSTLIASSIIGILVYSFTNLFKSLKPKLRLVVKQSGFYKEKISLSKREDGDYEASFLFAIRNDGNKVFKPNEGYWHTYILDENSMSPFSVVGEKNHQRDLIRDPIYPNSFTDIGHEWKFHIKKEKLAGAQVSYFFATDYGYFPKTVNMNSSTGQIKFSDMGQLDYNLK